MSERTQDPSANVLQLVGNATAYIEKMIALNHEMLEEKLALTVESSRRERAAETDRINSLRAVDVAAVGTANERAVKQAELLATNVSTSAETLRKLVAETATTIAKQLETVTGQLIERIAALEKVQYENQGRSAAPTDISLRIDELEKQQSEAKGRTGISVPMLMLISGAVVGVIVWVLESIFN